MDALYSVSANQLAEVCSAIGLDEGTTSEAFASKKSYVSKRLHKFDRAGLLQIIKNMKEKLAIDLYPAENFKYKITEVTKRDIIGVKQVLGGLSSITAGMSELRNSFGDGHGKESTFRPLPPRYAKLAVGASSTYALFILETYESKKVTT